jgi:hypothetical protein
MAVCPYQLADGSTRWFHVADLPTATERRRRQRKRPCFATHSVASKAEREVLSALRDVTLAADGRVAAEPGSWLPELVLDVRETTAPRSAGSRRSNATNYVPQWPRSVVGFVAQLERLQGRWPMVLRNADGRELMCTVDQATLPPACRHWIFASGGVFAQLWRPVGPLPPRLVRNVDEVTICIVSLG